MVLLEIQINDFSSFFELLIAFTFAYSGISGFRDFVNKLSLQDIESLTSTLQAKLSTLNDKFILYKNNPAHDHFQAKIDQAKSDIDDLEIIKEDANWMADGASFQSMFYLIGSFYTITLIVGGFQELSGDKHTFLFLFLLAIPCYIYFAYIFYNLKIQAKGNKDLSKSFKVYRKSSFIIKSLCQYAFLLFCLCKIICLAIIYFDYNIDHMYIPIHEHLPTNTAELLKSIVIVTILFIPVIPYLLYYKRKYFFLNDFEIRLSTKYKAIEKIFEDLQKTDEIILQITASFPDFETNPQEEGNTQEETE